jgi:hypothetical protein
MAKILKARKDLVQLLIHALGGSSLDDFASDFKVDDPGSKILEKVSLDGSPEDAFKRLLDECALHSGGLDHFAAVIESRFDRLLVWSDLKACFLAYQQAVKEAAAPTRSLIKDASSELEKAQPLQLETLQALSKRFPNLKGKTLQTAVREALHARFRERMIPPPYDELLQPDAPVRQWQDLFTKIKNFEILLDGALLAALEQALTNPSTTFNDTCPISSLLVMVLPPRDLPSNEECQEYFFRAFFCPDDHSSPDQWQRIDEKCVEPSIRRESFESDLQRLITAAILNAKHQNKTETRDLLIEIFLPLRFLHRPIGSMVKVQLPGGGRKELYREYPIVFRSSDRFQFLHEEANKYAFQNRLPVKWRNIESASKFWWHDTTNPSRRQSRSAAENLRNSFDAFAVKKDWFAMKRLGKLPETADPWLQAMLWACPAIAIWWRPNATSTSKQRCKCFEFCPAESETKPFGFALPTEEGPHPIERFHHPAVNNSLRLFFDLATTLHQGLTQDEYSKPFQEMVLLVDSPDRWPEPLDYAPGHWSRSADGSDVVDATEDDILISPG